MKILVGVPMLVLILVGSINFAIDPYNVFFKKLSQDQRVSKFIDDLAKYSHGIHWIGIFDERPFKKRLAQTDADCVIYGSSRIDQISFIRNPQLQATCKSAVNLGVSAAVFEDFVILMKEVAQRVRSHVIISLDPWFFKKNAQFNPTWETYKESLKGASAYFGVDISYQSQFVDLPVLLVRLFSIYPIWEQREFYKKVFFGGAEEPSMNGSECYKVHDCEEPMTLKDGSVERSKEQLQKAVEIDPFFFDVGEHVDQELVESFKSIVLKLQEQGKNVSFLLIPFRPNVAKDHPEQYQRIVIPFEKMVRSLGKDLNAPVFGSYRAKAIPCSYHEFVDDHHPTLECANKIDLHSK